MGRGGGGYDRDTLLLVVCVPAGARVNGHASHLRAAADEVARKFQWPPARRCSRDVSFAPGRKCEQVRLVLHNKQDTVSWSGARFWDLFAFS